MNIENVDKPQIQHGHQVLLRVGATGLCHSDLHLINGDWKKTIPLQLPIIPGHEIAGWVEEIGDLVPKEFLQKYYSTKNIVLKKLPIFVYSISVIDVIWSFAIYFTITTVHFE